MLFAMFDAAEAIAFAKEITSDLCRFFPNAAHSSKAKALEKERKRLDGIIAKSHVFAKQHRLNIYKKAKFLNTVKWELKEAGYEEVFIEEIVRLLANVMN